LTESGCRFDIILLHDIISCRKVLPSGECTHIGLTSPVAAYALYVNVGVFICVGWQVARCDPM